MHQGGKVSALGTTLTRAAGMPREADTGRHGHRQHAARAGALTETTRWRGATARPASSCSRWTSSTGWRCRRSTQTRWRRPMGRWPLTRFITIARDW